MILYATQRVSYQRSNRAASTQHINPLPGLRCEDAVGQLLSDLAVTASGQALPLACEENAAAVASGTEFVITGARVVEGSGLVKVPGSVGIQKFTLRFR